MSGSYCPACEEDSGIDSEDWFREHEHKEFATCQNCGAKLKAYYDENENEGGFWAFEIAEDEAPNVDQPPT